MPDTSSLHAPLQRGPSAYSVPMVVKQTSRGERGCDIFSLTTCIGVAASMGAVLLAGGAKGKRSTLPKSRILIHPASAGFQSTASDSEVQAREIIRTNARLWEMMAADTGQLVESRGQKHARGDHRAPQRPALTVCATGPDTSTRRG